MALPVPTWILIAKNHAVVPGGLRLILDSQSDLTIVAEVENYVARRAADTVRTWRATPTNCLSHA